MAARGLGSSYHGFKWIHPPTRYAIYYRDRCTITDQMQCVWCGHSIYPNAAPGQRRACLDHLKPVSRGGDHSHGNLVSSCFECNRQRGSSEYEEWTQSCNWDPWVDARIVPILNRLLTKEEREMGRYLWQNRNMAEKLDRPGWDWRH